MITRKNVTLKNVPMELLGQVRIIDEVNVIIEIDHRTGKANRILPFGELNRLEELEHIKIMKNNRRRK